MVGTAAPGLFFVIGLPILLLLAVAGGCLGLFIFWNRVRG
jgi:hypothetical protein